MVAEGDFVLLGPQAHSGRGVSYYMKAAKCGRLSNLEAESDDEGTDGQIVGTIFHKFAERYYGEPTKPFSREAFYVSDVRWDEPLTEAWRLFNAFQRRFPERDFWGTPCGAEVQVEGTCAGEPLSGRIDLVVSLDEAQRQRLIARTEVPIMSPGEYLVDWKTAKQKCSDGTIYEMSLQAANYLNQRPDAKGMMFVRVIRYKDMAVTAKQNPFQVFFVPRPDDAKLGALERLVQLGAKNAAENLTNPAACIEWDRPCRHYMSGACRRI